MPRPRRTLTTEDLRAEAEAQFAPAGTDLVGIELEWPVHRHGDVTDRPAPDDLPALGAATMPAGGRITFEPGGQIELSTAPFPCVGEALRAARLDSRAVVAHLDAAGFACTTAAVDDRRAPRRILGSPRYEAMESFFAHGGATGGWMMTNTAATQINISHDPVDPALRWNVLNRIAPVLLGTFANSPGFDLRGRRWASLRQAIWWSIDSGRTRVVPAGPAPAQTWLRYALAADVMFVAGSTPGEGVAVAPGMPFADWATSGHPCGWPTIEDFRYHLTTLFPPVRPRGWLEVRILDALPEWIREVAVLTTVTACATSAARTLLDRVPNTSGLWLTAIRDGLDDPSLATAAATVFDVVQRELPAVTDEADHAEQVAEYRTRYVDRRRSPGHDLPTDYDMRRPTLVTAAAVPAAPLR
jgi:glutamate--cysteine ligase